MVIIQYKSRLPLLHGCDGFVTNMLRFMRKIYSNFLYQNLHKIVFFSFRNRNMAASNSRWIKINNNEQSNIFIGFYGSIDVPKLYPQSVNGVIVEKSTGEPLMGLR